MKKIRSYDYKNERYLNKLDTKQHYSFPRLIIALKLQVILSIIFKWRY